MKTTQAPKLVVVFFILLALPLSLLGCAPASSDQSVPDEFQVSFKLDPRLLGATYGGERWVPPPYGPIAYSGTYTLEARAYYIDASGHQFGVDAKWIPADPKLVTVSPGQGDQVTITIQDVGETSVRVKSSAGTTKTLYIKATAQENGIQLVEISQ